uniref:Natterin-3 n=1 Tax=Thalassophryne nattereri TaxID=289382 RepID=NATT3_THANI|nr:RecName: Full=Natterin-3; Flags: Precursor [Thalassophryne nattereri]AAU11824.1 natterin 3 precursor [Thalassophryne nattereri]
MKLSVLVVTLLAVSWTSAQPETFSIQTKEANMNPEPANIRVARSSSAQSNLQWNYWDGQGAVPDGAVSIWNGEEKRTDYVCSCGCSSGFYSTKTGANCHYAYGETEKTCSGFSILVNRDNFENLEWKGGSDGSVPKNAVEVCEKVYVGKNKYGLGKVHTKHEALFLPWHGEEHWYKDYEVLTVNDDVVKQELTQVNYKLDAAHPIKNPPETLRRSSASNSQCRPITKTVALEKAIQTEQSWDVTSTVTFGVESSITAGIPDIASATVSVSVETSLSVSLGSTTTKTTTHTVSVIVTVPPNHYCPVTMVATKYTADIPFTGKMTRTYRNGQKRTTSITGTYRAIQVGEIRADVQRCSEIAGAKPC